MSDPRLSRIDQISGDGFSARLAQHKAEPETRYATRGSLTVAEIAALQHVADRTGLPFSVVGERGGHAGRNIETSLPFGDGVDQRSPIELAFPAEYDLLTGGAFTHELYTALEHVLGKRTGDQRGYWQAAHIWPAPTLSLDFYPHAVRRPTPAASAPKRVAWRD